MADTTISPLRRASSGVAIWLELVPEDARLNVKMALEKLVDLAEKEIARAYFDGQEFSYNCRRVEEFTPPQS